MDNLHIIGTSHVATQSIAEVKHAFSSLTPKIVAIELDSRRAYSLLHETKRPSNFALFKSLGLAGFLFYIIGEFIQKRVGKIVNINPGSEMLTALKLSEEYKCKVFLIDRDIAVTLRRFSKNFKKREVLLMIFDSIFGKGPKIKFNLRKVPPKEIIEYAISYLEKRYPSLHKILIDERDAYMAHKLALISKMHPQEKVLVIVGAGHVKGIKKYLA